MRVVLFKINWLNPKQAFIGAITWSNYCHTGLLFDKDPIPLVYDASESRGNVDYNKHITEFENDIIVYEIPENETLPYKYAIAKRYEKYDWKGIMGWFPFLGSNSPNTVYCFELVLQTLFRFKTISGYHTGDSKDLKDKLYKKPIDSEDILILLERAGLNPVYRGKAKGYKL